MSFSIERVPARLKPFDFLLFGGRDSRASSFPFGIGSDDSDPITGIAGSGPLSGPLPGLPELPPAIEIPPLPGSGILQQLGANVPSFPNLPDILPSFPINLPTQVAPGTVGALPLSPIYATDGLVFPYMPTIVESGGVKYDGTELTHANEAVYAYRSTENTRIGLSNCVWTCDTFDNAIYALAVLHFFRSYKLMDFGRREGTGRPPSPMWFSAYGQYAYNEVPVLLERADFIWPNDIDYVGIPNPGSGAFSAGEVIFRSARNRENFASGASNYTWLPIKFEVQNITLIVQHSVKYWIDDFSLRDFYDGKMINKR